MELIAGWYLVSSLDVDFFLRDFFERYIPSIMVISTGTSKIFQQAMSDYQRVSRGFG